ncbi:MAG: N-acetylmuramoyl-L-alanine amidase, partial [Lachnospiraceae bacterium]|nr:N-acetylmuramoyl-L-alanine amidase [Lachnospiraceae bacterium]
ICTVSIHQNSYPSPEVRGAQVFYYRHSTQAQKLAQLIQESIRERVDPDNTRQEKPNDSYYMLKRSTSPTVIVECGFLSCPKEAQLLTEEDYQNKLAWAIHMAVLNYVNQTES